MLREWFMARYPEVYKRSEWKQIRDYVISRANGLCEKCRTKGKIAKGKEVHHKIWLTEDNKGEWAIAYNPENLIYLCSSCHNDEHDRSTGLQKFVDPI